MQRWLTGTVTYWWEPRGCLAAPVAGGSTPMPGFLLEDHLLHVDTDVDLGAPLSHR